MCHRAHRPRRGTASAATMTVSSRRLAAGRIARRVRSLVALVTTVIAGASFASAASATCHSSSPISGSYTVSLCFTAPTAGAVLTGDQTVTVTADVTGTTTTSVQRMRFYLDGQYVLTDYNADYSFVLPTTKWADGIRTLEVEALMRDGFTTQRTSISVNFANGIAIVPINTNTFTPAPGTTPVPGHPFVAGAVGDGPDGSATAASVTDQIAGWDPNLFLFLGDVYEKGTPTEFKNWYHGISGQLWGRFKPLTNPVIGNHEYENGQAPGYDDYWNNPPDYYSYDAGGWHLIALNSNSQLNETQPGTPQYQWLQNDLGSHPNRCTIVYFHHPVLSVGPQGDTTRMNAIWSLLAANDVEMVIAGHDHGYQRWLALDGSMALDPNGITQFVVGSGGHGIQGFVRADNRLANGFDTSPGAFGALRLQLNQQGAGFQFVNPAGDTLDSGSVKCGGTPTDTLAPSIPTGVAANASSGTSVTITWNTPIDNVGVTAYDIFRDGVLLTSTNGGTRFVDLGTVPGAHTYRVRARDAAGNVSGLSASVASSGGQRLYVDNFETGTFTNWASTIGNITVQQGEVFAGTYSARAVGTGSAAWAYANVPEKNQLYVRLRFKLINQGANSVYLEKLRTATGGSLLGVFVNSAGKLGFRNDVAGATTTSSTVVSPGEWHQMQVRLSINGGAGSTDVWLDGVKITELTTSQGFGTALIGRIQIGENSSGRTFDVGFDDVIADTVFVNDPPPPDNEAPTVPTGLTASRVTATSVTLAWDAASDNIAVNGYTIYRGLQGGDPEDVIEIGSVDSTTLSFEDAPLTPSTGYVYFVDAFDAAGNYSSQSAPLTATTLAAPTQLVINTEADAYTNAASPTRNYGTSGSLRADGSPDVNSYLRFTVQGAAGPVTSATLRVYANSGSSTGHLIRDVADDSWNEAAITYANAPAIGNVVGSSGAFSGGGYIDVDVTPLVTGNGTYSFALTTLNSTAISYASRESANMPELILNFGP